MLSYDTPVAVNGQKASANTNMAPPKSLPNGIPTSSNTVQPAPAAVPNGVTSTGTAVQDGAETKHKHIWLVTGPAGCGKSTVAKALATHLNMPYIEGDEVGHPSSLCPMLLLASQMVL